MASKDMEKVIAKKRRHEVVKKTFAYALLCLIGVVMIYPVLWLFFGSFKSNDEIFGSFNLLAKHYNFDAYIKGWKSIGRVTYGLFFTNTLKIVVPTVVFTVTTSTLVAYGFARFKFPMKKIFFALMISTMMLPQTVIVIPRYILFKNFHWIDTYYPFIVPAIFGCFPFFIFMMVQFFRGIPRELDEAALIDGCNPFTILVIILLPLAKPAIISAAIFQFVWTWNDFFNSLIFINSVKKYPVSLALRMIIDSTGGTINWNEVLAMSMLAIIPPLLFFFFAQRYFVEGIATTGLKG